MWLRLRGSPNWDSKIPGDGPEDPEYVIGGEYLGRLATRRLTYIEYAIDYDPQKGYGKFALQTTYQTAGELRSTTSFRRGAKN